MADLKTQLTTYLDDVVRRVDVDDLAPQSAVQVQPPRRTIRPVWAAVFAFVSVLLLGAVGLLLANVDNADPVSPRVPNTGTVLMVPTNVSDDMELSHSNMWNDNGDGTNNPDEAVTTSLVYLPPGQESWGDEGERFVTIDVDDRFAMLERERLICYEDDELDVPIDSETCRRQLEESECSGLEAMREGRLDAAGCISEVKANLQHLQTNPPQGMEHLSEAEVIFTELAIRDRPALLAEIEGDTASVMIFEGGGVASTVTGQLSDREVVLEVAEGLQPATPDQYADLTAAATN